MNVLAALGLLFLGAIGGWLWRLWRPRSRGAWLGSTIVVTLAYLLVLSFPPPNHTYSLGRWALPGVRWPPLAITLNAATWPWALFALGLGVAVMWAAVRDAAASPSSAGWSGVVFTIGLLTLGAVAANPQTLLWVWVLVDLVILGLALRRTHPAKELPQAVALAWARTVSWVGLLGTLFLPPHGAALALALAVGWRLLWQPWEILGTHSSSPAHGLGVILGIGNVILTVVGLRFLDLAMPPGRALFLLLFLWLFSLLWAVRPSAEAPDFLAPSLGGLALLSVLWGAPETLPAWGALILLFGVPHRLGTDLPSARWGWLAVLPALMQWPWTPGVPLNGLWSRLGVGHALLLGATLAVLALGIALRVLRHFPKSDGEPLAQRWARILLPVGMLLPALAAYRWGAPLGNPLWRPQATLSVAVGLALGIGFAFLLRRWSWLRDLPIPPLTGTGIVRWPGQFLWFLYRLLSNALLFTAALLEGEGGVLWAIVLLVLLVLWIRGG